MKRGAGELTRALTETLLAAVKRAAGVLQACSKAGSRLKNKLEAEQVLPTDQKIFPKGFYDSHMMESECACSDGNGFWRPI